MDKFSIHTATNNQIYRVNLSLIYYEINSKKGHGDSLILSSMLRRELLNQKRKRIRCVPLLSKISYRKLVIGSPSYTILHYLPLPLSILIFLPLDLTDTFIKTRGSILNNLTIFSLTHLTIFPLTHPFSPKPENPSTIQQSQF